MAEPDAYRTLRETLDRALLSAEYVELRVSTIILAMAEMEALRSERDRLQLVVGAVRPGEIFEGIKRVGRGLR